MCGRRSGFDSTSTLHTPRWGPFEATHHELWGRFGSLETIHTHQSPRAPGFAKLHRHGPVSFNMVTESDFKDWLAGTVQPTAVKDVHGRYVVSLQFSKGHGLLKQCAYLGFKGMTLTWLKRLAVLLEKDSPDDAPRMPKSISENKAVEHLMKLALGPTYSATILERALESRHGLHLSKVSVSEGEHSNMEEWPESEEPEGQGDGMEEDAELDELHRELRYSVEETRSKHAVLRSSMPSMMKVADVPEAQCKQRKFVPVAPTGMTASEAAKFLPASARLSKDTTRENRWRLRSKLIGCERTKSYGKRSRTTDREAMIYLIQLAWAAEFRASGQSCPFDFEGETKPS